jgi:serine/threonine protein kinase
MVDNSGNARIMDFGLATIARDSNSLVSTCDDHGSTFRWAAPEVLGAEPISKASDVFSFGMVMIEVRGD